MLRCSFALPTHRVIGRSRVTVDVRVKDSSTATERVGRYQLLEPIGGGANGSVSRAKVFGVAGFERQFAVKRFIPELTVGAMAQALSAAARSYGSLEHPRIARMSEFGVAQGQTFTAVEYVPGLDVFRLLTEAKLAGVAIAAGGALALVSQAARAVGYAHGRGLSHLGLSPTNVIVTSDGDVKVTDFGILSATMPPHPAESPRLVSRVPYLSPEQISGEATSAASDVFVLGVIAYELVTGQRAYRGDTPAQIAAAILAGPPAEPPLPRPIVRVLQRCLARSPFERFPDARALADALDAALRVAPVPGTRKDVGAQVKTTLERYAALNEGNASGMVALNLHGARDSGSPSDPLDAATTLGVGGSRPEARTEPSPMPAIGRTPTPPPLPAIGRTPTPQAGATMRDMPKPFMTMPGLAPPPIPVPPGVTPPPSAPTPILPGALHTIPG
jgi:eukaryotic-like serine/threonine-protein kinase